MFVILLPLLSLVFGNIFIPNILSHAELSKWRVISSIAAFAGLMHIGIADGAYITWLKGERALSLRDYIASLTIICLLSGIVSCLSAYILRLGHADTASLFILLVMSSLMSFSVYFSQIFLNGLVLNISLILQSSIFILLVIILSKLTSMNAGILSLVYALSCIPIILITLMARMVTREAHSEEIRSYISLGLPIIISNLGIIIFVNADKILSRRVLHSDFEYASYTIQSSLFTAGASLGLAAGGLLVSKKVNFRNRSIRLFGLALCLFVTYLVSPIFSTILNSLLSRYSNDYQSSVYLGALSFYVFSVYFSYSRLYLPRLSQSLLFLFPLYYLISILLSSKSSLGFANYSILSIIVYVCLCIAVQESVFGRINESR